VAGFEPGTFPQSCGARPEEFRERDTGLSYTPETKKPTRILLALVDVNFK
jgi:hypothetical protein